MFTIEQKSHKTPELFQIVIKNKTFNIQGSIFPNLGATLQEFKISNINIIEGIDKNQLGLDNYQNKFNSAFLFPFFGRIPKGEYLFKNKKYQFDCNSADGAVAVHGHLYNKKFELINHQLAESEAELQFEYIHDGLSNGYPFPYVIQIKYVFTAQSVNINVEILNSGTTSLPFGLGWHPYFRTESLNSSEINFESQRQVRFNEKLLPDGEMQVQHKLPLMVGKQFLDDGFILEKPQFNFKTDTYSFDLKFSSLKPNSYLQAYIPEHRKSIALEPLTCVPNCLNNGIGLQELAVNKRYSWKVELKICIP